MDYFNDINIIITTAFFLILFMLFCLYHITMHAPIPIGSGRFIYIYIFIVYRIYYRFWWRAYRKYAWLFRKDGDCDFNARVRVRLDI